MKLDKIKIRIDESLNTSEKILEAYKSCIKLIDDDLVDDNLVDDGLNVVEQRCYRCKGTGEVVKNSTKGDTFVKVKGKCPRCAGYGFTILKYNPNDDPRIRVVNEVRVSACDDKSNNVVLSKMKQVAKNTLYGPISPYCEDMYFMESNTTSSIRNIFKTYKGQKIKDILKRYIIYRKFFQYNVSYPISLMSISAGVSVNTTLLDLEYLIQEKYFKEGYVDDNRTMYITWEAYLDKEKDENNKSLEVEMVDFDISFENENNKNKIMEEENKRYSDDEILEKLQYFGNIFSGEICIQVTEIKNLLEQIFTVLSEEDEHLSSVRKMRSYYNPTTIGLLEQYEKLANIKTNKHDEIEKEINEFLKIVKKFLDSLLERILEDDIMDFKSEVEVTKSIIYKDSER